MKRWAACIVGLLWAAGASAQTQLYSYDLRGQLSFGTLTSFLQLACPLSIAIDVKTMRDANLRAAGGDVLPDAVATWLWEQIEKK